MMQALLPAIYPTLKTITISISRKSAS